MLGMAAEPPTQLSWVVLGVADDRPRPHTIAQMLRQLRCSGPGLGKLGRRRHRAMAPFSIERLGHRWTRRWANMASMPSPPYHGAPVSPRPPSPPPARG